VVRRRVAFAAEPAVVGPARAQHKSPSSLRWSIWLEPRRIQRRIPEQRIPGIELMKPWSVWRRLLILWAVAFLLSAWLYCLATMHTMRIAHEPQDAAGLASGLMVFFRDNGAKVLATELAGLAICAAVMVITDRPPLPRTDKSGTERRHDVAGSPQEALRQPTTKDDISRYD
jgi:hypothetical protein